MTRGVGGHSPANIMEHIQGIDLPATKHDLIEQARKNNHGPDTEEVVDFLERLPVPDDQKFEKITDISKAIGEETHGDSKSKQQQ